ncbi:MAG: sulfotransferase family protein [Rhodobacteraceae bacterium]|nr:MAG: sulfotransferase family protein [Paracoccaceae bacterium]
MRIVMWSGPRNLSTAMMYSFAARGDCAVWDEPFYAPYLKMTGLAHPMADAIIAAHEDDAEKVAAAITGPIPGGKPHFYMKHMPHHMVEGVPMGWTEDCVHVHLIRHPARVIASYVAKREDPTLEDIGFAQQQSLFERLGGVVIDSHDIRANPGAMLKALCSEIEIAWTPNMLNWSVGGLPEDGVWAAHWYGAVQKSTGFAGVEGDLPELSAQNQHLCDAALPAYQAMQAQALRV